MSLAPHATELLFAAGAGERIVGVLAPADWPPEAARVPRVGTAAGLDLERIVALKPDLVIVWPYLAPAQIERLRALGIAVFVSDPRTPAAIAMELERLGTLAGTRASAARAAAAFRARLSALASHERDTAKLSVFYEIWHQPLYTVGGGHLITAAIRLCGGENIFAALAAPAPAVGVEDADMARRMESMARASRSRPGQSVRGRCESSASCRTAFRGGCGTALRGARSGAAEPRTVSA